MTKIFVESNQIIDDKIEIFGEDVKHISNVLRLKCGEDIIVCDKQNKLSYNTQILEINKEKIICKILNIIESTNESSVNVTIFQGLPKADKMEYIIQKSTELGAKKIVPVAMRRSVVKIDKKDENKKILRWQKIAQSAAEQSGRDMIPKIENVQNIKHLVEEVEKFDIFLIAYENEKNISIKKMLQEENLKKGKIEIGVLIGPEGGIDKEEIDQLIIKDKVKIVSLGKRILRTETASLFILSNIMYEYDM